MQISQAKKIALVCGQTYQWSMNISQNLPLLWHQLSDWNTVTLTGDTKCLLSFTLVRWQIFALVGSANQLSWRQGFLSHRCNHNYTCCLESRRYSFAFNGWAIHLELSWVSKHGLRVMKVDEKIMLSIGILLSTPITKGSNSDVCCPMIKYSQVLHWRCRWKLEYC